MLDTKVGTQEKDAAAKVARDGFDAMMSGESDVVSGWQNKLQTTVANVTPNEMLAEQHRKMAEPGTAEETASEKAEGKSEGKTKGKSTGS
jgi:hypothetical protein